MISFSKPIRALAAISAFLGLYLIFQMVRSPPSLSPFKGSGERVTDWKNDPMSDRTQYHRKDHWTARLT